MPPDHIHAVLLREGRDCVAESVHLILVESFDLLCVNLEDLFLVDRLANISDPFGKPLAIVAAGPFVVEILGQVIGRPTSIVRVVRVNYSMTARELCSDGLHDHAATILLN